MQRVERAVLAASRQTVERDLFVDSAALNLHDFYAGLERIFVHIATGVDQCLPSAPDWYRELLRQMAVEIPRLRPQVISGETSAAVDEYRRFRHVVRNVYAFEFDPARIELLAGDLRPAHNRARGELLAFATFLENLAEAG